MLNKLRPLIARYINLILQKIDVNPNIITLIGLVLSFFAVLSSVMKFVSMVPLLIVFSSIADVLDGAVARAKNRVTPWGSILDSFCDRIEEFNYLLSLIILGVKPLLAYFAMFISFLISYLRTLGEKRGIRVEGIGILERGERVILVFISALAIAFSEDYGISIANIIMLLIILLGIVTIIQRLYHIFKELRNL
jgi:archaetidylinositol phosphate synthase